MNRHAATLEFPPAAARAGLVAAGLADGLRDGGFGVRLRGRFGVRAALDRERGIEAHGGGGLGIGQDGLDCAKRLARERPGLLAPSEVLVAAGSMRASRKAVERSQLPTVFRCTPTN